MVAGAREVVDGDRDVVREHRVPAPAGRRQFMAAGQRLAPGTAGPCSTPAGTTDDRYFIPTPVVAATAAFNHFATGKAFQGRFQGPPAVGVPVRHGHRHRRAARCLRPAHDHRRREPPRPPVGPGRATPAARSPSTTRRPPEVLRPGRQPGYVGEKTVKLPMSIFPSYITSQRTGGRRRALRAARITASGPSRFSRTTSRSSRRRRPARRGAAQLPQPRDRGNALSRRQTASLKHSPGRHAGGGGAKAVTFEIAAAQPRPANAYPCTLTSPAMRAVRQRGR